MKSTAMGVAPYPRLATSVCGWCNDKNGGWGVESVGCKEAAREEAVTARGRSLFEGSRAAVIIIARRA
jgi:hypothetical protein